jgi:hypothetical protein
MKKNNIEMYKNSKTSTYDICECMVCLENIDKENSANLTTLYCSHYFHTECINEWLNKSQSCPICKQSIYKIVLNEWFETQYKKWEDEISNPKPKKKFKFNKNMCIIS